MSSSNMLIVSGLILFIAFIAGAYLITQVRTSTSPFNNEKSSGPDIADTSNKQIIELTAKGGYSPAVIDAKADKETILRVKTSSTFDCSAALTIPSLNYSKILPSTGATDIPLEPQPDGTQIEGTCSMGMYRFILNFKS